ncbi:HAMP domain-containing sensor histidine kinase [Arachidicoccus ginsenosidivorans]|uniref:histidine kinase n=1 Tax=Arachidicoccus ginsenosidivorans TaxID=496057 RepID=A0A5B8VHL5_9BACT|nr:HAMP domain-containing sensor histidine kinase [Arachidicoccus ginsenosidivorans]QEC70432.1 HAMP domain-containing histidine kinase [Arachidicoccus ginsenosidivorans]
MKIRNKIILYFSVTTIALTGLVLYIIYTLFGAYRREEFQQRLSEKITFSLKFLGEVQQTSQTLLNNLDRITINDLYDEKMLLFDGNKQLIYASLDDTKIHRSVSILGKLGPGRTWLESKEGKFDVVGVYVQMNGKSYYGIYKAYDTFGYTQKRILAYILWGAFAFITIITLIVTFYLSREISSPINKMAREMNQIQLGSASNGITVPDTKDEINYLATRFNELMQRLDNSFAFQRHAVHHISHELKTPITILVSNFDQMEKQTDPEKLKALLLAQKEDTRSLGDIINALLEISKLETGNQPPTKPHRIDELLFDAIEKVRALAPDFEFQVSFAGEIDSEDGLMASCNPKLMHIAFSNLLLNCVRYSRTKQAQIKIKTEKKTIYLTFVNDGATIQPEEQKFLFNYFFRGQNSKSKAGFGLGLVMVHKIIQLHKGQIEYKDQPVAAHLSEQKNNEQHFSSQSRPGQSANIFLISMPLS